MERLNQSIFGFFCMLPPQPQKYHSRSTQSAFPWTAAAKLLARSLTLPWQARFLKNHVESRCTVTNLKDDKHHVQSFQTTAEHSYYKRQDEFFKYLSYWQELEVPAVPQTCLLSFHIPQKALQFT